MFKPRFCVRHQSLELECFPFTAKDFVDSRGGRAFSGQKMRLGKIAEALICSNVCFVVHAQDGSLRECLSGREEAKVMKTLEQSIMEVEEEHELSTMHNFKDEWYERLVASLSGDSD